MSLVVPCNRGGVPLIAVDLLARILSEPCERLLAISVFDTADFVAAIGCNKVTGKRKALAAKQAVGAEQPEDVVADAAPLSQNDPSFLEWIGIDASANYKLILSVRSSLIGPHSTAPSTNTFIAGDHDNGRVQLQQSDWVKAVAMVRPTHVVPCYDSPAGTGAPDSSTPGEDLAPLAPAEPSRKRLRVAVERSTKWLRSAEGYIQSLTSLKGAIVMLRAASVLQLSPSGSAATHGVVVENVNQGETLGDRMSSISTLVKSHGLPPSTVVFMQAESVPAILCSLLAGGTHIESSLAFSMAKKGEALILTSYLLACSSSSAEKCTTVARGDPVLYLYDPKHRLDNTPLVRSVSNATCRCYTCQRSHSRAYLHHLLIVHEMNAEILLAVHNLTQLVDMFRGYRAAAAKGDAAIFAQNLLAFYT